MADREQLLNALRAADAAGDVPAAQAIARRLAATPARAVPPVPEVEPEQPEVVPVENTGENLRAGLGRSFDQGLDFLTEMYLKARGETSAAKGLEENVAEKRRLDAPLMASGVGQVGYGLGEAIKTGVGTAGGAGLLARAFPKALAAYPTLARYGLAAGGSAATEAAKPIVGDEDRADAAATGAVTGLIGQGVGDLGGRVIKGLIPKSKDALKLAPQVADEASLGQLADRSTKLGQYVARAEEASQSIPLTGSVVRGRRAAGLNAERKEILNAVAPKGYTPKGENTREVVDDIAQEFGKQYKAALAGHKVNAIPAFEQRMNTVLTDPKNGLTPANQAEIKRMVQGYHDHMFGITAKNPVPNAAPAEAAKDFEAFLSQHARNYRKSGVNNPQGDAMAEALNKIEDAWEVAYRSQLPRQARQATKALDQQYAPFKTVERAASYVGNDKGDFSMAQLLNAVKARSPSSTFARGRGLLQDRAQTGKAVFGDKLPDSGTPERALAVGALLSPAAYLEPSVLAGAAVPAALATKPGRNLMLGDTALQRLLQQLRADKALRAAGPAGAQFLEEE